MKKLMIAAAAAALVGGVTAGTPQVYDFTATLKATECSGKQYTDACAEKTVNYRVQKTKKLYGKFWGCECKTIACPENYAQDVEAGTVLDDWNTFVFWFSTKAEGAVYDAEMTCDLLQRLGKKGENVEGSFGITLKDKEGNEIANLNGAGYGTARIYCDDTNYIKSMSGNLVGTWDPNNEAVASGCVYCGEEADCEVLDFCSCVGAENDIAAAFGSFTIKYNASQVKSLRAGKRMTDIAFKKNAAVLAAFNYVANDSDTTNKTPAQVAQEQYTNAKNALADAEAATNTTATAYAALSDGGELGGGYATDPLDKKIVQGYALKEAADDKKAAAEKADDAVLAGGDEYKAITDSLKAPFAKIESDLPNAVSVEAVVSAYVAYKVDEAKYSQALNNASKYGTAAQYTAAKNAAEDAAKKGVDFGGAVSNYNATVVAATTEGYDVAENKKAIADFEAALDKYIAALNEQLAAEDAKTLWADGEVVLEKDALAASIAETDLDKIDGTYSKAYHDARAAYYNAEEAVEKAEQNLKYAEIACTASGTVCK